MIDKSPEWLKYAECLSVSFHRWLQTCTTCWSTMATSWTVEESSKWRGRGRWPLTSSPVVLQAVNRPANRRLTSTALFQQTNWGFSSAARSEAICWHMGTELGNTDEPVFLPQTDSNSHVFCVVYVLKLFPKLPERWLNPVALGWS